MTHKATTSHCLESWYSYTDDCQLYISLPAADSQYTAARLAARAKVPDGVKQTEIERREDLVNLDSHYAAAGLAVRHSTQAY